MTLRSGDAYLKSLQDDRAVFIDGERVSDVSSHPAFQNTAKSFASFYDAQSADANAELMRVPAAGGGEIGRVWAAPRTLDEMVRRREAFETLARLHHGFLGRSPDHLATTLSAMVMNIDVFQRSGEARAKALLDYFEYVSTNDLFVTYVIQNPQANKTISAGEQARDLVARVVDEDAYGITLQGAKMLGTSSVMANELLVSNIQPLRPGEERYAFSCALPVATRGLSLLSRRSYEQAATSGFDYPLSSNLDENDAIVHFDNVKVPWERVFLLNDIAGVRAQWQETTAHVYQNYQSQIRLMVKLQFLVGLAHRIAETTNSLAIPQIKGQLGSLAAQATLVRGLIHGMEANAQRVGEYLAPSAGMLYAAQTFTQALYPQVVHAIREIAGGGLIMLPSSVDDFRNPDIARMIAETQVSSVTDALGRVKLFKLSWDALGSEFASRHLQYEMFYGGAPYVNQANMYQAFDWAEATAQVDTALARMGTP